MKKYICNKNLTYSNRIVFIKGNKYNVRKDDSRRCVIVDESAISHCVSISFLDQCFIETNVFKFGRQ